MSARASSAICVCAAGAGNASNRVWRASPAEARPYASASPAWPTGSACARSLEGLAEVFYLEVKAPVGKLSEAQQEWLRRRTVERFEAVTAHSLEWFDAWYRKRFPGQEQKAA